MGRLPLSGNKTRKIKIGTTVQETTAAILEEIRRNNPESIRSTGEVIDYLCNLLAELTPRAAKVVDEACAGEVQLITNEMRTLPLDGSEEMSFSQKNWRGSNFSGSTSIFLSTAGRMISPRA